VNLSKKLAGRRAALTRIFALAVFVVAGFVLWRSAPAFLPFP